MAKQDPASHATAPRRLARSKRREQILIAAAHAFTEGGGFAATSLDDVAHAAGVTRMILYRHFESKVELYQAVIDRAAEKLYHASTEQGELHEGSILGMLRWATDEPAAFRLLFHQAAREPQFRADIDRMRSSMADTLHPYISKTATSDPWARWSARLATTVAIEAIMCWLDTGKPDPGQAGERILQVLEGIFDAAGQR